MQLGRHQLTGNIDAMFEVEDDRVVFRDHDPDAAADRLREEDGHPVLREAVDV